MITEILFSVIVLYGLGFNGTHNITEWDCPIIDGEWRSYDLLYRGWCHLKGLVQPLEPEQNYDDDDDDYHNNPDSDYPDYFLDENLSSSSDIDRDGNVTLGAECGARALNDDQVYQELSEDQCFYFNSCMNLGGSIQGCYDGARTINCDIENDIRYNCPAVAMGSE